MRRGALFAVTAIAVLALQASPASAAVFNVSNTAGLVSAVATANNNAQADTINVAPGTYTLSTAPLVIGPDNDVTIDGTGTAAQTVIRQTGLFRVIHIDNTGNDVSLSDLTITGGFASGAGTGGSGAGIRTTLGSGATFLDRVAVEGNRVSTTGAAAGGGGIYNAAGAGAISIQHSSVSNNVASITGGGSGGAGLWSNSGATISDSTFSGNALSGSVAGSGAGGYFTAAGGGSVSQSTFADNSASAGRAMFAAAGTVPVDGSIFAGSGSQCGPGVNATGANLDSGASCTGFTLLNTNPQLGPLGDNGGGTKTRALAPTSPAIEAGGACASADDQRGIARPVGGACDLGAFEFDGLSVAQVPNCSPTGQIPLGMVAPPGNGVVAFHYKLDGAQTDIPTPGGGSDAATTLNIPEGRRTLEYWGEFTNDVNGEKGHHLPTVLVDKTDPSVAIQSEQKKSIYVITRKASVDVNATDALSGLTGDPSANGERLGTRSRGKKVVTKTATDLCGNQQSATLDYRVLGPGLGTRAVLEKLQGKVRIKPGGASSAGAAQKKGGGFVSLSQSREIPIGSFLDTKKGRVRLTSSKSKKATAIQDGQFSGGVFQVLQSRRARAKGLTELRLKGGKSFKACATGKGASASLSKRALRRLRANAKGRFRTRGRFSAATVRGTKFTVTDRCDGTLTKVTRGRVAVRDFRRHKTVVVRAGKSYLAKAAG
jgi:hypothetical protein